MQQPQALSLLDLSDDVLERFMQLLPPQAHLAPVCLLLQALCHAYATAATISRGYYAAADPHVAILVRFPLLKRLEVPLTMPAGEWRSAR